MKVSRSTSSSIRSDGSSSPCSAWPCWSIDQLVGPIYHRALIVDAPIDDDLVNSVVDSVVAAR